MKKYGWIIVGVIAVLLVTGVIEYQMGRLPLGPDGTFGLYSWNVWSSEQSQRVIDPYSLSHFIHGLVFYGFLWLVARRMPAKYRFLLALIMEAAWELLENSPIIINRYRAVTISYGYEGDSILNSLSDIVFVGLGFWYAMKVKVRTSIITAVVLELFALWWVRDNLTLNVIMLVHPIEAIKQWQAVIAPPVL